MINFFKSKSIFYFNFLEQLPFSFLKIFLPLYDTLFCNIFQTKTIHFFELSDDGLEQLFYEKLMKRVIHFFDQ
ncbi:hypothetical protein D6L40_25445, partial [Vibrio alginolyticus]|nr:hypothetical protein [Vibrio alginolyticus]